MAPFEFPKRILNKTTISFVVIVIADALFFLFFFRYIFFNFVPLLSDEQFLKGPFPCYFVAYIFHCLVYEASTMLCDNRSCHACMFSLRSDLACMRYAGW